MSRLRRLVLSDRYFFVTCNLRRDRSRVPQPFGENELASPGGTIVSTPVTRAADLKGPRYGLRQNRSHKLPLLAEREFASLADAIASARETLRFLLTGWVFLPDHWHAIIFPPHPLTISKVLKIIKARSTHEINLGRKTSGELWQARFYEHALRTVKEYHDALTYIHLNPVKRGLVPRPEDWAWSSIHSYGGPGEVRVAVDRVQLPSDLKARL